MGYQSEELYSYLRKLYKESYQDDQIPIRYDYYYGDYNSKRTNTKVPNMPAGPENANNVIKQLIDTKTTLALDNQITSTVTPKIKSMASIQQLSQMRDLADIYNDCLKDALKQNNMDSLKSLIMREANIASFYPVEIVHDSEGNPIIETIEPSNLRYIKSSTSDIRRSPAVFIKMSMSIYEAKKRFNPDKDELINAAIDKMSKSINKDKSTSNRNNKPTGVVTMISDTTASQAYAYGMGNLEESTKSCDFLKVYIKDDSVFQPETNGDKSEEELKAMMVSEQKRFPNGRVIVIGFIEDIDKKYQIIFEDKPIAYKYGFPIRVFMPFFSNQISNKSLVDYVRYIQDRINYAHMRIKQLSREFMSAIAIDPRFFDFAGEELVNMAVLKITNLNSGGMPQVITRNTIDAIQAHLQLIQQYKSEAKEIARINDMMLSGELPGGNVNSAKMVEGLKEDPQSSIREIQRNFKDFYIGVCKDLLYIIKNYYHINKIVKISGDNFAQFLPKTMDGKQIIRTFNSDGALLKEYTVFDDLDFDVEVIAGTELPRTRTEMATLTNDHYERGLLGDKNDPETIEELLIAEDFPNWRAIVRRLKDQQEANAGKPLPMPIMDKISASLKDLPPDALISVLEAYGIVKPQENPVLPEQIQGQEVLV